MQGLRPQEVIGEPMGIVQNVIDSIARKLGMHVQSETVGQAYRDIDKRGETYSIEFEVSDALADTMLMFSAMDATGNSERAVWLDSLADEFFRKWGKSVVVTAFITGDALVVPAWNGRNVQNVVVPSQDYEVLSAAGEEYTSVAYVVDRKKGANGDMYRLMQAVELVPYTAADGTDAYANRYRMFVSRNDSLTDEPMSNFPDWEDAYDSEWYIPNVNRLLVAHMRSVTVDPANPNALKGLPICYGASQPIKEIHYLLAQMHDEFDLSEKMIMADKRLFKKERRGDETVPVLPHGRERLYQPVTGASPELNITEWAPDIRYQAYLDAIDKQEKLVERAVGVSYGVLSRSNETSYANVDNIRQSQQRTMGFINASRKLAEVFFLQMVYVWETLANYYEIVPEGPYDIDFDWSDEYVETFAERRDAILAGEPIGATDAVDYRTFVMDESPETARARVEEIKGMAPTETREVQPETLELEKVDELE